MGLTILKQSMGKFKPKVLLKIMKILVVNN